MANVMPAEFNEIRRHTTDRLVGGFCYSGTMTCVHSIRKWILTERKSTKLISVLNCHHFKSLQRIAQPGIYTIWTFVGMKNANSLRCA